MSEMKYEVIVKCPQCGKRVIDKLSPSEGTIRLKCPHCHQIVSINLSFRKNGKIQYRIAN